VAEVRGNDEGAGVAVGDELGVDHGGAEPDVGEQAAVAIAGLDVELERDRPPRDELRVEAGGRETAGLPSPRGPTRARVVSDLGGVHADVAHALDALADAHVDRVAVVDVDDGPPEPARRIGERRGDQDPGDAGERCSLPHRPHAVIADLTPSMSTIQDVRQGRAPAGRLRRPGHARR
jgi:hypothetical protein